MSRESFPELPEMPEPLAKIPLGVLAQMINSTIFAISSEESRFTLNGALLLLREDGLVMVSTDGHRLSLIEKHVPLPGLTAQFKALLPRKAMAEIQKLASDDSSKTVEFSGNENHLFFRIDKRLLLSRKLTGNFPDFERVLPKEHPHAIPLNRDEFRGAVERVSQFSDERSKAVRVKFSPGELSIHSSLSDTGESEETLAVEYSGAAMEIGFNATYMLEFLRVVSDEQVTLLVRDPNSAGELRPGTALEGSSYRYVVMPMRI
jgi:DNA polymerase-3 subunit beta